MWVCLEAELLALLQRFHLRLPKIVGLRVREPNELPAKPKSSGAGTCFARATFPLAPALPGQQSLVALAAIDTRRVVVGARKWREQSARAALKTDGRLVFLARRARLGRNAGDAAAAASAAARNASLRSPNTGTHPEAGPATCRRLLEQIHSARDGLDRWHFRQSRSYAKNKSTPAPRQRSTQWAGARVGATVERALGAAPST